MPILTKKRRVDVAYGMKCDCCGMVDENGFNDFAINHGLGYDSPLDMTRITAAICDTCLLGIVIDRVPGAVAVASDGRVVPRTEMEAALARRRKEISAAADAGTTAPWFPDSSLGPLTLRKEIFSHDGAPIVFTVADGKGQPYVVFEAASAPDARHVNYVVFLVPQEMLEAFEAVEEPEVFNHLSRITLEEGGLAIEIHVWNSNWVKMGEHALTTEQALKMFPVELCMNMG